ncbi:MAG TPA: glycerophosphodiester phosphodiesterase [Stellaceae bacterium]|nr:glycerophosphodiester phosphodiesterase [Stellaceae bacterium]
MLSGERRWPRVIGHRGAALSAPENTLAGLRAAAALGVAWVEFDVRLTGDGRAILLHDDTLERTTTGRGPAAALGFAEIRRFDAGAWFGAAFRGERVPSLEEAIELLAELRLGAVVELKPAPGAEEATGSVVAGLVAGRWPASLPPPLLSSFKPAALAAARRAAPELERALLVGAIPGRWREEVAALGCGGLHVDQRRVDRAALAELTRAGLAVFAYTVNRPERAQELFSWGVDAVFSDCPDRLAAGLGARGI